MMTKTTKYKLVKRQFQRPRLCRTKLPTHKFYSGSLPEFDIFRDFEPWSPLFLPYCQQLLSVRALQSIPV